MARSEHNREAYRALFLYVGAALQAFAILMILVSFPIAPTGVVAVLLVVAVVSSAWSWRGYRTNFMMPTFVGVAVSALWVLVIGVGAMVAGWGP